MASNPLWRQPLRAWKRHFSEWIQAPTGGGPLNAMIFFDFRVLHGDTLLGDRLRDHVVARVADQRAFLSYVVNQVVANRPPIGFFGSFVVEKGGEHKDQLNLKARGLNPLVDLVRFLALEKGVRATGTLARIDALREAHADLRDRAEELAQAFEFLTLLRAHAQYERVGSGAPVDNFINPNRLSNLEKRSVKEAFQLVSSLQDRLVERFKASIL
jgi:CBS domain-containing protein